MSTYVLFFSRYRDSRDLHSFPTRRSSDLSLRFRSSRRAANASNSLALNSRKSLTLFRNVAISAAATITDRKSTRLNSSHLGISYAVFCLKKKRKKLPVGGRRSEHRMRGTN